jgi:hypothetical protein
MTQRTKDYVWASATIVVLLLLIGGLWLLAISSAHGEPRKPPAFMFYPQGVVVRTPKYESSGPAPKSLRVYHEGQTIHIGETKFRIAATVQNFVAVNGVVREFRCVGSDGQMYTVTYLAQYTKIGGLVYAFITVSNVLQQSTYHSRPVSTYYHVKDSPR